MKPVGSQNSWTEGAGYDVIPRAVMADRHLTVLAKLVYALVCGLARQTGSSWGGAKMLARVLGVSRDVVDDALDCLVHAGLLKETKRSGTTTLYSPVKLTQAYDKKYLDALDLLVRRADGNVALAARDAAEATLARSSAQMRLGCPSCARRRRDAAVRRGVDNARSRPKPTAGHTTAGEAATS
ncbi:MAG: hypothetical protein WCD35_19615 [Mycobacteriales bacterium]